MAKGRKTFEVDAIRQVANDSLRTSANGASDFRQGIIAMVERILMDSGNYRGFIYLDEHEVPQGALPGVRCNVPSIEKFDFTDDTRRVYS